MTTKVSIVAFWISRYDLADAWRGCDFGLRAETDWRVFASVYSKRAEVLSAGGAA